MVTSALSRHTLFRFVAAAALMAAVVGCGSSGDPGGENGIEATPSAEVGAPQQQLPEAGPESAEGAAASQSPTVERPETPTVELPPEPGPRVVLPPLEPDEPAAAGEGSGTGFRLRPNPLRPGPAPPHEPQFVTRPAVSGTHVPEPKSVIGKVRRDRRPYDAVKENGPVFVGWPEPKLVLVITGRLNGYLEPCGCAGDQMKGGLSRRHSMFESLRGKGWPVIGLDVGGLCKGSGRQAELKFQTTVDAMRKMRYDAIGLGKTDLRLPAAELVSVAASIEGQTKSPFVSANVGLFGFDAGMTESEQIVEIAGMKVGITSILGKKWQKEINNPDIELADPKVALAKLVPALKARCNLLILLAHATRVESIELAKQFPDFDVVVTAGGPAEPAAEAERIEGTKARLIEVGETGMNAVVLGLFGNPGVRFRYQRVPLDSRFENSPEMKLLMTAYQDQLRQLGFAGLGIRAVPHPDKELMGAFVGSKKCVSCHEESYDVWKKTGHAKAYATLVGLDPPRNFDPECISCHVIGWHPRHYFPYQNGFRSAEKTPELIDVGCESCHGPGGAHVEAEMGSDEALQKKLQEAMVITKDEADVANGLSSEKQQCINCHDGDNSPDFNFEAYWPLVKHYEDLDEEAEDE